jgi:hypothetical protein
MMGCDFSKVTRKSSPPLANRTQEAQRGTTGGASAPTITQPQHSQAIDPAVASLLRPQVQSPTNAPVSRPPLGVIRRSSQSDQVVSDAKARAQSGPHHRTLSKLDLPIGDVLTRGVMENLFGAGGASSSMLLDGGNIKASYDEKYKIVRLMFGNRYYPVNVELDDSVQLVRRIVGFPPPSKEDLRYLVDSNCLSRSLLSGLAEEAIRSGSGVTGASRSQTPRSAFKALVTVRSEPTIDFLAKQCIESCGGMVGAEASAAKNQIFSQVVFDVLRAHFESGPKCSNKRYSTTNTPANKKHKVEPSFSRQYLSEFTREGLRSLEGFAAKKVGNCHEMAMLAAVIARRLGLEADVWVFPGHHAFCIVGHIPKEKSALEVETKHEHLWTIDLWAGICCPSTAYDNAFISKMDKWSKNGKEIRHGVGWVKANSPDWLQVTVNNGLPIEKSKSEIPGYSRS